MTQFGNEIALWDGGVAGGTGPNGAAGALTRSVLKKRIGEKNTVEGTKAWRGKRERGGASRERQEGGARG